MRPAIPEKTIAANAVRLMKEFDVRASGPKALAATLSGGNQQKLIVAREFGQEVALLVLDQPTRGLTAGVVARLCRVRSTTSERPSCPEKYTS